MMGFSTFGPISVHRAQIYEGGGGGGGGRSGVIVRKGGIVKLVAPGGVK